MKTFNIIIALLAVGFFASCEKDTTGGLARETQYPLFEVSGDDPMFLELGTTWSEPGVIAKEGSNNLAVTTTVQGAYRGGTAVDGNVSDRYDISYSATNKDGFAGSASRTVYVVETGDLVNSITGLYTSTIIRNGVLRFSNLPYVLIWKNSDGTYELSCGFGAYYEIGTNYGLGYKSGGAVITANDISANDFTFAPFSNDGFGGAAEMTSMTVDAANKKINFVTDWSFGYTFEVELTQVEI